MWNWKNLNLIRIEWTKNKYIILVEVDVEYNDLEDQVENGVMPLNWFLKKYLWGWKVWLIVSG
jgi:hypothetical protein